MAGVGTAKGTTYLIASLGDIEADIPNLAGTRYSEESEATDAYNCIAFAFGDTQNWWWPIKGYGFYWPPGFDFNNSVDTFARLFEVHGYVRCNSSTHEHGYEKVVIYGRAGRVEHAARQLRSGCWVSKLGEEQDIEHDRVEDVECPLYGSATLFFKRKREDWL
jgi:hypothetical protein